MVGWRFKSELKSTSQAKNVLLFWKKKIPFVLRTCIVVGLCFASCQLISFFICLSSVNFFTRMIMCSICAFLPICETISCIKVGKFLMTQRRRNL